MVTKNGIYNSPYSRNLQFYTSKYKIQIKASKIRKIE